MHFTTLLTVSLAAGACAQLVTNPHKRLNKKVVKRNPPRYDSAKLNKRQSSSYLTPQTESESMPEIKRWEVGHALTGD